MGTALSLYIKMDSLFKNYKKKIQSYLQLKHVSIISKWAWIEIPSKKITSKQKEVKY